VAAAGKFFRPADFDTTFELGWSLLLAGIADLAAASQQTS
jgi:hypothetical protein